MLRNNLGNLRYFIAFAELQRISAVAVRFDVNESTVSRALRAFQEEVGHPLFSQNGRKLNLTDYGLMVYNRLSGPLKSLDEAYDNISKVEHEIKGTIRLSTAAGFASTHLVNLQDRFCEIYPGVRFETRVDSGLTALRSCKVDIITLTSVPDKSDDLVMIERGINTYEAVASPDFIEKFAPLDTVEDLKKVRVFAYGGRERESTKFLYRGTEKKPIVCLDYFSSDSLWTIKKAVLEGKGVAIDIPRFFCLEEIEKGTLVPILSSWRKPTAPLFTVLTKTSWNTPKFRIFAQWFSEESRRIYQSRRL